MASTRNSKHILKSKRKYAGRKVTINPIHTDISHLSQKWRNPDGEEEFTDSLDVIYSPFKLMRLKNFLVENDFVEDLKAELEALPYVAKENDLYQFSQSDNLILVSSPAIAAFKKLIYNEFKNMAQAITGFCLIDNVDLSSSQYRYTDYLLCHDDRCENRKVAFIYYLVPEWSKRDGGALDLFSTGEEGLPSTVNCSLVPEFNSFIFFEVSPKSFHQVSEVLAKNKCRLAIGGWLYEPKGEPVVDLTLNESIIEETYLPHHYSDVDLREWINPVFLEEDIQQQIRSDFESKHELVINNFLKKQVFDFLSRCLVSRKVHWIRRGPANMRHYEVATGLLPKMLYLFIRVMKSAQMFSLLGKMTAVNLGCDRKFPENDTSSSSDCELLSDDTGKNEPKCEYEIMKLKRGSYSTLHDCDGQLNLTMLDVMIHFNSSKLSLEAGGDVLYFDQETGHQELIINPTDNALSIMFKERGTYRFTKYVNAKCKSPFHNIYFKYHN